MKNEHTIAAQTKHNRCVQRGKQTDHIFTINVWAEAVASVEVACLVSTVVQVWFVEKETGSAHDPLAVGAGDDGLAVVGVGSTPHLRAAAAVAVCDPTTLISLATTTAAAVVVATGAVAGRSGAGPPAPHAADPCAVASRPGASEGENPSRYLPCLYWWALGGAQHPYQHRYSSWTCGAATLLVASRSQAVGVGVAGAQAAAGV